MTCAHASGQIAQCAIDVGATWSESEIRARIFRDRRFVGISMGRTAGSFWKPAAARG